MNLLLQFSHFSVIFCLEGKGVYGFLTGCQGQALFFKKSPHLRVVFFEKTLTALNPTPVLPSKQKKRPMRRMTQE